MSNIRKDENGYLRKEFNHSDLIHRQVAYKKIYLPNRDTYPLPFSKYQVHHKDRNKQNNAVSNLLLVTKKEHEKIHNINKNNDTYFDKIIRFNKKRKKEFKSQNNFKNYNNQKHIIENPFRKKGLIFIVSGTLLFFSSNILGLIFVLIGIYFLNKK